MAITDIIPWKKTDNQMALRRQDWDPFNHLRRDINQMFDGWLGDWTRPVSLLDPRLGSFMPQVDVKETAKEIRVAAELPGIEEKDLEVSLVDGALHIRGEKREEHEEEKGENYRCERLYGAFERTIPLPAGVEPDKVNASFKKGVLKVTLPKTKESQSNRRTIPVQT